jgi:ABC-type amino acid transport substrate-binding protein
VGYSTLDIPFSYLNSAGDLVGYDIAYAYQLARDLDCTLEFIPVDFARLGEQIADGEFDIAMSAVVMNEERIKTMDFSQTYQEQNVVLIVPTKRIKEFLDLHKVEKRQDLKILTYGFFSHIAKRHFPYADLIGAQNLSILDDPLENGQADAILWTKLQGFAWCLNHPWLTPIDYGGQLGKCYLAYPVALYAIQWVSFLDHWLSLKEQSGFQEQMTRYWLKGEKIEQPTPRWSIIRNVLHWID